jgi:hypothetical protein
MASGQEMPSEAKQIVHRTVDREKMLCLARRFEATPMVLSLASQLMRDLGAVVQPLPSAMPNAGEKVSTCCSIAAQTIGYDCARHILQPLQQFAKETLRGTGVPSLLHQDIEHLSILVDRAPQIVVFAPDRHEHFIEMPDIAETAPAISQLLGKWGAELQTPLSHGLTADAHSALG